MNDFMPSTNLSKDEKSRYMRHILLSEIGEIGQLRLKQSSILCVGAGGLGSPALLYLAAAGVGRIGIIDSDSVESSNLQRQVLYSCDDIGELKTTSAKNKLLAMNPFIQIETFNERFDSKNAERILSSYDAIMDGTDNFSTRYLVNDVAIKLGKPNFFGCIFKFTGQISVFGLDNGCYRCLFPQPPSDELSPDCASAGVLGALPGIVGTYQALEFIKWRLGFGETLFGKLMTVNTLQNQFRTLRFSKNPNCICQSPHTIQLKDDHFNCSISPSTSETIINEISVKELKKLKTDNVELFLIDVRNLDEFEIGNLGGVLIPLSELDLNMNRLPNEYSKMIIVHCHSGKRSAKACIQLMQMGYENVHNLTGGIVAWNNEADKKSGE